MNRKTLAAILFSLGVLLTTGIALAQAPTTGIASCNSADGVGSTACTVCSAVTLAQNIINFAIMVSFPIAAVLFGWAGFLYMTSALSAAQITKAHQIFKSTAIGIACVLLCWTIVDAVIHQVMLNNYATFFASNGGNWYQVPACTATRPTNASVSTFLNGLFAPNAPAAGGVVTVQSVAPAAGGAPSCPAGDTAAGSGCYNQSTKQFELPSNYSCGSGTFDPTSGGCKSADGLITVPSRSGGATVPNGDIAAAAAAYQGTATNLGPDGGNLACAWAVNNVLQSAGIAPIDGNSVAGMQAALQGGRGTAENTADAQPGDIIVWKDDSAGVSHVGICETAGCTETISNSSSRASFTNVGGSTLLGVAGQVYRVNK